MDHAVQSHNRKSKRNSEFFVSIFWNDSFWYYSDVWNVQEKLDPNIFQYKRDFGSRLKSLVIWKAVFLMSF